MPNGDAGMNLSEMERCAYEHALSTYRMEETLGRDPAWAPLFLVGHLVEVYGIAPRQRAIEIAKRALNDVTEINGL